LTRSIADVGVDGIEGANESIGVITPPTFVEANLESEGT